MAYRDKKTGKFVSESTWKRSKARGGSRYVRTRAIVLPGRIKPTIQKPTRASVGAPVRRQRPQAPAPAPAKSPGRKRPTIDHILTVAVKSRRKSPRSGRMSAQEFKRDIIVPAPQGATKRELIEIAKQTQYPRSEQYIQGWLYKKGSDITVAEGPRSRGRKAKTR